MVTTRLLSPCCSLCLFAAHRSGDVGLGLNARRLRDRYLASFSVTYSLRPIGEIGSVFRRYPGMWQVRGWSRACGAACGGL